MAPTAQKTELLSALLPGDSAAPRAAGEFCGFYAANAETNKKSSQVVLDRTDDKDFTTKGFYRDMFDRQVKKADVRAVFTEYAWDMNWCDPCAADPLSHEELRSLGVFWLTETPPDLVPGRGLCPIMPPMGGARDVYTPRMHARGEYEARQVADRTRGKLADLHQQMTLRTAEADKDDNWWQNFWTS